MSTETKEEVKPLTTGKRLALMDRKISEQVVQLAQLTRERDALFEALEMLHSYQNGPPLYCYEKQWNAAMEQSAAALKLVNPNWPKPASLEAD